MWKLGLALSLMLGSGCVVHSHAGRGYVAADSYYYLGVHPLPVGGWCGSHHRHAHHFAPAQGYHYSDGAYVYRRPYSAPAVTRYYSAPQGQPTYRAPPVHSSSPGGYRGRRASPPPPSPRRF